MATPANRQLGLRIDRSKARTSSNVARVREMQDDDLARVLELRSVVRWSADPRAFDLLRGIRGARWAVADALDGSLAGMVGAVPLGEIGVLCQLAVRDGLRGAGLGRELSSWAVRYLRSKGTKTIRLYATREAERLYRSQGFEPTVPRTIYRFHNQGKPGRVRPGREPQGRYRVSTLVFGDLPELYGLDLWSYGADRSALLLAILRLHPGWGLVARDTSGRIKGYLVRSSLGQATRLGPFVAAGDEVAGLLLENALVTSQAGSPVEVTVPGNDASPAHAFLKEFGFEGREDRLRMELGKIVPLGSPTMRHYGTTPYLST